MNTKHYYSRLSCFSHVVNYLCLFLVMCIPPFHRPRALASENQCFDYTSTLASVSRVEYTVHKGDTLSEVVYKYSKSAGTRLCLYGPRGWVLYNERLNPHIQDWRLLPVGAVITLEVPLTATPTASTSESMTPTQVDDSPNLPSNSHTTTTDAVSSPQAEPQVTEQLDESSELQSTFLFGRAIAQKKYLKDYSYLAASLQATRGLLSGLHLSIDHVPYRELQVSDHIRAGMGWTRYMLGHAWEINATRIIDKVTILPRIHILEFKGLFPQETDHAGIDTRRVKISSHTDLRLKVIGEWNVAKTKWSPWIEAGPSEATLVPNAAYSVENWRWGLNIQVAGPTSSTWDINYLLFTASEHFRLMAKDQTNAGTLGLRINTDQIFAGIGLNLGIR